MAIGYSTLRAEVASNIINLQVERLLTGLHNQLVAGQFAQKGRIPQNKGDTVEWHKKMKLARATTALAEDTDIVPKKLYMTSVTKQAEEWADAVRVTRRVWLTAKHLGDWNQMTDSLATVLSEMFDYETMSLLAGNGYRMRADNDTTYQVDVTATSDGATTTTISTSLTQADDFWNGGYITCTNPETTTYADRANYCETRLISDFDNGTTTATHAAFDILTKSGATFHLCVGTGIVATDVLDTASFSLATRQLKRNKGIRFNDALITKGLMGHKETSNLPPGAGGPGYWVCIIDQDHEYDFMKDTTWVDTAKNVKTDWLVNGEISKWMGTKVFGMTQPWREDVDGTENESSGIVHPVHFLASDAYGISAIDAPGAEGDYGVVVNLKTPKDYGDVGLIRSSISGQGYFAMRSLNSLWNVTMLAGSTA